MKPYIFGAIFIAAIVPFCKYKNGFQIAILLKQSKEQNSRVQKKLRDQLFSVPEQRYFNWESNDLGNTTATHLPALPKQLTRVHVYQDGMAVLLE